MPLALVLILLAGCALLQGDNYKRPAMVRKARVEHVEAYGVGLTWPQRVAYIEGRILPGMPSEFVEILYGEPDLVILCPLQNLICDRILVYSTNNTHVVGSASVRADTVVEVRGQLAAPCRF